MKKLIIAAVAAGILAAAAPAEARGHRGGHHHRPHRHGRPIYVVRHHRSDAWVPVLAITGAVLTIGALSAMR